MNKRQHRPARLAGFSATNTTGGLALCAGLLLGGLNAAEQPLPTPAPSGFADTESSVNVALPDWPDLGRNVKIDLSAFVTPSNAIQIAFGQDENGDENLEPEETRLVLGVDCGESFVRDETGGEWRWGWTKEDVNPSATATNGCIFTFKQPSAVSDRVSFAKVTTRGREDTAAQIAAEVRRPGLAVIVK